MLTLTRGASAATLAFVLVTGVPVAASASTTAKVVHCTKTASGSCIRGGEFCPSAANGHKGVDVKGRVFVCKSKHWRLS